MNKYRNKITYVNGMKFDSKKEALRYLILKDRQDHNEIRDLQMQVPYELLPAVYEKQIVHLKTKDKVVNKCIQRAVNYIADFVYNDSKTGKQVIEDVKGRKTKEYLLKKKMMRAILGLTITET